MGNSLIGSDSTEPTQLEDQKEMIKRGDGEIVNLVQEIKVKTKQDTYNNNNILEMSDSEDIEKTISIVSDTDSEYENHSNIFMSSDDDENNKKNEKVMTLREQYIMSTKSKEEKIQNKKNSILEKRRPKQSPVKLTKVTRKERAFLDKRIFFYGQTPTNCTFIIYYSQYKYKIHFVRHMFRGNEYLVDWIEKRFRSTFRAHFNKKYAGFPNPADNHLTLYLYHYDKDMQETTLIDL